VIRRADNLYHTVAVPQNDLSLGELHQVSDGTSY
jgi:hypothetical protein